MRNLIGQTLDQYQIVEQIGQGSMATVFKARQRGLERWVALKVLHLHYTLDPASRQQFRQEAQAIANLEHPHILPVYDFGQDDDYTYLVMRYIDDSLTLADVMRAPFSFEQALDYLEQIAGALDYAHRRGMIHRDVKPANILLKDHWLFLTDFGLVRLLEGATQLSSTHIGTGTPAYMSPEQGAGGKIDPRTDVYAAGVIAYEMLTGQIPHLADTAQAMIYRRNHEPPPSLRDTRPEIPVTMDRIAQKALATRPADRFGSAGAFVTALRQAAQEIDVSDITETVPSLRAVQPEPRLSAPLPTVAAPIASVAPSQPSRRWLWWLLGGLVLLVILIVPLAIFWFISTGNDSSRPGQATQPPATTLSGTLPGPTATPLQALFFDNFDNIGLDLQKWQLLTRGGQVQVNDSLLRLNGVGQTFPLVYPRRNPFPTEGNFSLKLSLRYLSATEWGSGFRVSAPSSDVYRGTPVEAAFLEERIVEIWQDSDNWRIAFGRERSPIYSLVAPELVPHEIEINYINRVYQIALDGREIFVSEPTTVRPTFFWIGSPLQANAGSAWSGLEIDRIVLERLDDTLTLGPTAAPASTPIAALTATLIPTVEDTPTPVPTVEEPPTPTPLGQNCPSEPDGPFAGVWQEQRQRLGCPTGGPQTIPTMAEEIFQGGHTFWRSDTDEVYIVYDRDKSNGAELLQGQWQLAASDWKWDGSNPDGVGMSPPPGLVEPKRGFGWLWRVHLDGPDGPLGWALDREYGFDNLGLAQEFEQGLLFKGSGSNVYVLLQNGQFFIR